MNYWTSYASVDVSTNKIFYKGIDIGLSRELIHDLRVQTGLLPSDVEIERLYNIALSKNRDKKINEILDDKNNSCYIKK